MFDSNLLSDLSFIAGPALLTNASTVLLLGATNRYGLALDRARKLAAEISDATEFHRPLAPSSSLQLATAEQRVVLLLRSMALLYVAVAGFGLGTLSFLLGVGLGQHVVPGGDGVATISLLVTTLAGVCCLVAGAGTLAWESRLSYALLSREADIMLARSRDMPKPATLDL
ncbi:DUF2721 domain-containing protein [Cupriavidus sp. 30B13]|uniref:DUF2721 domain-containing protein n=1 Tax=Cupriavidus sp. 30B13 TaxID=3384241 RepID=UPI003B907E91